MNNYVSQRVSYRSNYLLDASVRSHLATNEMLAAEAEAAPNAGSSIRAVYFRGLRNPPIISHRIGVTKERALKIHQIRVTTLIVSQIRSARVNHMFVKNYATDASTRSIEIRDW